MANILITGASSGIGEALAYYYAKDKSNTLFISGRNKERLAAVAKKCQQLGATVEPQILDVTLREDMKAWIEKCHKKAPLNLIIANAGVATDGDDSASYHTTFDINVGGVLNTVLPAIELLKDANYKHKQIAIVSSLAGYFPMAQCPAYSASKHCVKALGLAFRGKYKKDGIDVNVICPGFIRSRITDKNTCPMPFFMETEQGAKKIANGIKNNKAIIAFPWVLRFLLWLASAMPYSLISCIMNLLPKKN